MSAARRKSDPLEVECRWKYCRSKPGQPCSTIAASGPHRGDFVDRKPHAVRWRDATRAQAARIRAALRKRSCANGCGVPPAPPSLVICKPCQEAITRKLEAIAARLGAAKEKR